MRAPLLSNTPRLRVPLLLGMLTQAEDASGKWDIRRHNPHAAIYVTTNPLITDLYPAEGEAFRKRSRPGNGGDLSAEGDGNVRYLEFATQDDRRDGFGGDYNPTVKTHIKMAKKLVETLGADLKWKSEAAAKLGR